MSIIKEIANLTSEEKTQMVETNYQNLLKYRLSEVQEEMRTIYRVADEEIEKRKKT